jgi:hypothetical protein
MSRFVLFGRTLTLFGVLGVYAKSFQKSRAAFEIQYFNQLRRDIKSETERSKAQHLFTYVA